MYPLFKAKESSHSAAPQDAERSAHEDLYRRHVARVLVFARQLTGNQADAEDLTQEVFLAAFRGLERFAGRSSVQSWLLGIAVRRWRDEWRRRQPQSVVSLEETVPHGPHAITPHDALSEQVVTAMALNAALEELSLPLREAFLLVAVQGLTHREAAEMLGRPVGTIKWRVAEATHQLRQILTGKEEESGL